MGMIRFDASSFLRGLSETDLRMKAAVEAYVKSAAKKVESEAKKNAPWTDRTSNARNSIKAEAVWKGNKMVLELSGNMDYSIWLEVAREGKYAILWPTIQSNSLEILEGMRGLLNR